MKRPPVRAYRRPNAATARRTTTGTRSRCRRSSAAGHAGRPGHKRLSSRASPARLADTLSKPSSESLADAQQAIAASPTPAAEFGRLSRRRQREVFFQSSGTVRASLIEDTNRGSPRQFVRRLERDEAADVPGLAGDSTRIGANGPSTSSASVRGARPTRCTSTTSPWVSAGAGGGDTTGPAPRGADRPIPSRLRRRRRETPGRTPRPDAGDDRRRSGRPPRARQRDARSSARYCRRGRHRRVPGEPREFGRGARRGGDRTSYTEPDGQRRLQL